jgi:hypothetical protein
MPSPQQEETQPACDLRILGLFRNGSNGRLDLCSWFWPLTHRHWHHRRGGCGLLLQQGGGAGELRYVVAVVDGV